MRQTIGKDNDPGPGVSISTHSAEYSKGAHIPMHAHGSGQLIYASSGVMEVVSGANMWLIPPHFGLWIPPGVSHEIRMPQPVSMRTLYLRPRRAELPRRCTVLHVSPLLRELILEVVRIGTLRHSNRTEASLRNVLVTQMERASPVPTGVTLPKDSNALRIAHRLIASPGEHISLAALCATVGISVRTLQRAFRRDAGIDFETWRRQVRLMKAVQLLVSGSTVKEAAYAVGYSQSTAFVELFKATFGTTPKAWTQTLEASC